MINPKIAWEMAKDFAHDKSAQAGGGIMTAGVTIVALLIIGFVGIMILNSTHDATKLVSGDSLYNASENLVNVTGTVFSMYGVLVIVLIASVIIGLLLSSFMGAQRE